MSSRKFGRPFRLAGVSVLALALATTAFAQDEADLEALANAEEGAATQPAENPAQKARLDEIIVTANKRAENIQDVPVSMSAIGGETLKEKGLTDLSSVMAYTPNVDLAPSNAGGSIRIRGLGSMANDGFEESVGFYTDDIYYARNIYIALGFLDLDRIEVLRGPQGTLFGKNTVAGAVNVHTSRPRHEWGAEVDIGFGDLGFNAQTLSLNAPIWDDVLAARLSGNRERREGYTYNSARGLNENKLNKFNTRAKLLWDVNDRLSFLVGAGYAKIKDNGPGFELTHASAVTTTLVSAADPQADYVANWRGSTDAPAVYDIDIKTYTLHGDLELGDHNMALIVGHSNFESQTDIDADGGSLPLLQWNNLDFYDQTSAELRLISPPGKFEYVAGLYYFQNKYEGTTDFRLGNFDDGTGLLLGIALPPALQGLLAQQLSDAVGGQLGVDDILGQTLSDRLDQDFIQDTFTYAAFGQITGYLTEDLSVVVGARVSHEIKEAFMSQQYEDTGVLLRAGLGITEYQQNVDRSESNISPKASIKYQIRDDLMIYATVAEGYKAGGFNPFAETPENVDFEPESSVTTEGGIKGRFFDSSVEMNFSLFRTKFDDLQVSVVGGTGSTFIVGNAAKATSQGFELDGQWAVFPGFMLAGALGWTDATFDSYPNSPCIADPANTLGDPNSCDASGKRLTDSPEWNGHIGANWMLPLQALGIDGLGAALILGGDALYASDTFLNLDYDPASYRPSYWQFDARIGLVQEEGAWAFLVNASNITDEKVQVLSVDAPLQNGSHIGILKAPRLIKATFQATF
ncbi:MAG: TonB-dependent receptor [Alphaproteobacteria bacterium]